MDKKFVGAIDQGTTGTRFILFNHEGLPIDSTYREHEQIFPKPGWVEHDPLEIVDSTNFVIKETINKVNTDFNEISAIGVTNQRETTVIWNKKSGKPVHNAVVWQCTRTDKICDDLKQRNLTSLIQEKTGLLPATYFSGPKIQWILENVPNASKEAHNGELLFGNIDTWLIWNLTGGVDGGSHITDVTNASRTMLMDLKSLKWDNEILQELKIPETLLPEIRPSSDPNFFGNLKINGINGQTPIGGAIGDQQAALVGQTCFEEGSAKNTYGTGCFLLLNTGEKIVRSTQGLLTTVAYGIDNKTKYAMEGSVAIAGAAIQWLRDQLQIIETAPETEIIASQVSDNGGVYFVPAFVGLYSPYWDTTARGTIVGLTRGSSKAHLVRAVLESVAFQSYDVFQVMVEESGINLSELRVDGGACKNNLLMQIQSNLLGINVIRPTIEETTALGASYVAGLASGFWSSLDELKEKWAVDRVFEPNMEDETRSLMIKQWKKAIEKSKGWTN